MTRGFTSPDATLSETAYFEDSDIRSANLTWQGSYKHEGRTFLTEQCVGTISLNGSGSGTGRFVKLDSDVYPPDFGLPVGGGRLTALTPNIGGTAGSLRVRGQIIGCGRDSSVDRIELPYGAPVLLPGSVAELAALPSGTRINREYSYRDASTPALIPITVRYEAVKHAVPPLPIFVVAPTSGYVNDATPILHSRSRIFTDDKPFVASDTVIYHIKAGVYTLSVYDGTKRHNLHLVGAGIDLRTPVAGTGTFKWRVRFGPARCSSIRTELPGSGAASPLRAKQIVNRVWRHKPDGRGWEDAYYSAAARDRSCSVARNRKHGRGGRSSTRLRSNVRPCLLQDVLRKQIRATVQPTTRSHCVLQLQAGFHAAGDEGRPNLFSPECRNLRHAILD